MRKVIKINEKITVMQDENFISILDDTTFIPLSVDDIKLICKELNINENNDNAEEVVKKTPKKTKKIIEEEEEEVVPASELPTNPFK